MKNIISMLTIILGFTLIILTIIFKDGLSEDHCMGIGFMGFLVMISGITSANYFDD